MSVFTPVSQSELVNFLCAYDLGDLLDFQGIEAGAENSNFYVTTTQGEFVLTLLEHYTHQQADYFLHVVDFLAQAGIPVAAPILSKDQQRLLTLNAKPALLVPRLAGETLGETLSTTPAKSTQCAAIGYWLARIHLCGQHFPLHRAPDRSAAWREACAQQLLPLLPTEQAHELKQELAWQQQQDYSQLPIGLIHADLFCDNVLFDQQQLTGIIDWYYACTDSWLYDLAIVINDWCCQADGALDAQKLQACLQAYQAERPLWPSERQQLAGLLRAAALRFWLSRLLAWHTPVPEGSKVLRKDPHEFRQKLLQRRNEMPLVLSVC